MKVHNLSFECFKCRKVITINKEFKDHTEINVMCKHCNTLHEMNLGVNVTENIKIAE